MLRNVLAKCLFALALLSGLNACIEYESDSYSLQVKARGLSDTETIILFNGSNLELRGTADLSWTKLQTFKRKYKEESPNYNVRIVRQPTGSDKLCRVLNPTGQASKSVSIVRIECGYPLVIVDAVSYASMNLQAPSMTTDNGLIVSNYLQDLALNSSRTLIMSLDHEVVQDPNSIDPNDQALRVTPNRISGSITFQKLYNEGEPVTLSFASVNQGCEIAGANDNSGLVFNYPSASTFMSNTVQTITSAEDWILAGTDFSNGRTCSDFTRSESYLTYDELENSGLLSSYSAECYPAAPVEMTCGLALKVRVSGLNFSAGEFIRLNAIRSPAGSAHSIDLVNTGTKTFNLAFDTNGGDTYTIDIDTAGSNLGGKTCTFSSTSNSYGAGIINNNVVDVISCI